MLSLNLADRGTMVSPIGPIGVLSGESPSLGGFLEPRVGGNLFSARPLSPISESRLGPSTPDPHDHRGCVRDAFTLIHQSLETMSRTTHNPSSLDPSPAPMSGSRAYPSWVEDSPMPLSGTRSNRAVIIESPTPIEGTPDNRIVIGDDEEDPCSLPSLKAGSDDEGDGGGALWQSSRSIPPSFVAAWPASPVPPSGTRDHSTVAQESLVPMSGTRGRPCLIVETPRIPWGIRTSFWINRL